MGAEQQKAGFDLIGKDPLLLYKNNVMCGLHFEENQFMNAEVYMGYLVDIFIQYR